MKMTPPPTAGAARGRRQVQRRAATGGRPRVHVRAMAQQHGQHRRRAQRRQGRQVDRRRDQPTYRGARARTRQL